MPSSQSQQCFSATVKGSFLVLLFITMCLNSCKKDDDVEPSDQSITITNFYPTAGDPGTNVIIYCKTFQDRKIDKVLFNGTTAEIIEATSSRVSVNVPAGATTGKITVFAATVSATSDADFTVTATPGIASIEPPEGPVGTEVTIHGTNFSTMPEQNEVVFSTNRKATVTSASKTTLTVIVPAESITGPISVTVNNITKQSDTNFTIIPTPQITGSIPAVGVIGTSIIINGNNFSTVAAENIVKISGVRAIVTNATTYALYTKVPFGASSGKIEVTVNGISATSSSDFLVTENPVITSFTPLEGAPGTSVTISGNNFNSLKGSTVVMVNSKEAAITNITPAELSVTIPSGAATGKITVYTNVDDGSFLSATSTMDFSVPAPVITDFTPKIVLPGETVIIKGNYFSTASPLDNIVRIGGFYVPIFFVLDANTISVIIPPDDHMIGDGIIFVTVGNQTAESQIPLIIAAPPK